MKLLQRGHQLVNERISPTSGMGWTSRNDLKESGHTNEVQHIQRENKESGCVPDTGRAAHRNQKHGEHQGDTAEI
jgi:hypothetical protein